MKGHIIVWRMLHITLVLGYSYVFTTLLMYLLFIRGSSLLHSNPLFCYLQNDAPMRGVVNLVSQLCSTWSCLIVLMGDSKEAPIPCPFSLAMMVLFFMRSSLHLIFVFCASNTDWFFSLLVLVVLESGYVFFTVSTAIGSDVYLTPMEIFQF